METCSRKIHFCYGHRVMNHESKCATLHGHNGNLWIHARPLQGLDEIGRVVDFSVLKEKIGSWVDEHWDHTTILFKDDVDTCKLVEQAPGFKKPFILPTNPTAENMANYLLREICPKLLTEYKIEVFKVTLYETENCFAEAML